jgi:hypothetical protein
LSDDLFECYKCGELRPPHMYHQKNRDGKRSKHKYCKVCRNEERAAGIRAGREGVRRRSAEMSQEWVFVDPLKATDFIKGESLQEMKKRMGVNLGDLKRGLK